MTLDIPNLVTRRRPLDPGGNTFITTSQVMCFGGGTRIATPDGERAAETLRRATASSRWTRTARRSIETVRWVGSRTLVWTIIPDPTLAAPSASAPARSARACRRAICCCRPTTAC